MAGSLTPHGAGQQAAAFATVAGRVKRNVGRGGVRVWLVLYLFVGIEMAWVLRPFVGAPGLPVQFFRHGAWGNAYTQLIELMLRLLGR